MQSEDQLAADVRPGKNAHAPTLVLMHFLGGSHREWDEVLTILDGAYTTVTLDLPGFGDSAGMTGYAVAEMADAVETAVLRHVTGRYILVGHSMSGKVAMVAARRAASRAHENQDNQDNQDNQASQNRQHQLLAGILLVAPSPPSPEPIADDKRSMMLGLLGERHDDDRARARSYITKNEARDIAPDVEERASLEVLRMNRTAWVAWLEHGSKEDWAERVGVLDLPSLVVAGEKDLSLGPKQQIELTMSHLKQGKLETVPGCSHLIPMECPSMMAQLIGGFVRSLATPQVPAEYVAFLESDRLSDKTREVLEQRMQAPARPEGVLNPIQVQTLSAMLDRIIPQPGAPLDLTAFVLTRLASGKGDGWRYDVLPNDVQAYRDGLDHLARQGFSAMSPEDQDAALEQLNAEPGSPNARWFEEVRGDATAAYVAHPATLARFGYSGFGVGGADTRHKGYVTLGPNQREEWEPLPAR